MNYKEHAQQAWLNIGAAKLRSLLAVLGILVGTAAVVALISCGQLATAKALEQFKALGTDLLAISLYQQAPSNSHIGDNSLSLVQWQQIAQEVPSIIHLAPYSTAYQPLSFQGKTLQAVVIGVEEHLAEIVHINLARGHFLSFLGPFEHFCVIGNGLAQQLRELTLDDPIGKQLRIGQALYTIIGVANPWKENAFFNEDINQAVMIPLGGINLVSKDAKLNNAVILLKPNSPIDIVIQDLQDLIHAVAPKLSIFPRSAKQIIASMESQGRIFTLLLGVIGGVSLLVGGIGVMNVMLVSVSERKKEIGIRKAVGATNRDIQQLFLLESLLLSLLGGSLGVLLGLIFTWVVAYFSNWTFHWYFLPPIAGFVVSAATGVFFGFYPAKRAAQLEPIVCLRSE